MTIMVLLIIMMVSGRATGEAFVASQQIGMAGET